MSLNPHGNAAGSAATDADQEEPVTAGEGCVTGPRPRASDSPAEPSLQVRPLRSHEDLRACVALQKEVWGEHFSEVVPAAILKVSQRVGGVAAGAFDAAGGLLGFVFGITGPDPEGRLVHWSDMLAVRPGSRNLGIGRMLKGYQREVLEAQGVGEILWTFDPLVARNAHLNLMRLGARVVEYVPDMYGSTGSPLHQGLGTDRFIVSWLIGDAARTPPFPRCPEDTPPPLVNPVAAGPPETLDLAPARAGAPFLRVQIPADIEAVQRTSPDLASAWRLNTRMAIAPLLDRGYRIVGVHQDADAGAFSYLLASPAIPGAPGDPPVRSHP